MAFKPQQSKIWQEMVFDLDEFEVNSSLESISNVNVAIRIKPTAEQVMQEPRVEWIVNNAEHSISQCMFNAEGRSATLVGSFKFDQLFDATETTSNIYNTFARSIVQSAMVGINGTIFAYGQTSSGKTFTMNGDRNNPGIIRMGLEEIFQTIESVRDTNEFVVRLSYLEIYNENITDLLNIENKNLKIHETVNREIYVGNATEYLAMTLDNALEILEKGELSRTISSTNMNERSSRSHTILRVVIENRGKSNQNGRDSLSGNSMRIAILNFVDLAGSERAGQTGAEGIRLKEGGHINKSLLALTNVICKLAEGDEPRHIPFRDSKLTRILQPSLGGNSKTCIICTVSLLSEYCDETLSTLKFALRAKSIKNVVKINEIIDYDSKMKKLQMELEELRQWQQSSVSLEKFKLLLEEYAQLKNTIFLAQNSFQLLNMDKSVAFDGIRGSLKRKAQRMEEHYCLVKAQKEACEAVCLEAEEEFFKQVDEFHAKTKLLSQDLQSVHGKYNAVVEKLELKTKEATEQGIIIEQLKAALLQSTELQIKEREKYEKEVEYLRSVLATKDEQEALEKAKLAQAKEELSQAMDRRLEPMIQALADSEERNLKLGNEIARWKMLFAVIQHQLGSIKAKFKPNISFSAVKSKLLDRIQSFFASCEEARLHNDEKLQKNIELIENENHIMHQEISASRIAVEAERSTWNMNLTAAYKAIAEEKTALASLINSQLNSLRTALSERRFPKLTTLKDCKQQLKAQIFDSLQQLSSKQQAFADAYQQIQIALNENQSLLIKTQKQLKESVKKEAHFDKIMKNLESQQVFGKSELDQSEENRPNPKRLLLPKKHKQC